MRPRLAHAGRGPCHPVSLATRCHRARTRRQSQRVQPISYSAGGLYQDLSDQGQGCTVRGLTVLWCCTLLLLCTVVLCEASVAEAFATRCHRARYWPNRTGWHSLDLTRDTVRGGPVGAWGPAHRVGRRMGGEGQAVPAARRLGAIAPQGPGLV